MNRLLTILLLFLLFGYIKLYSQIIDTVCAGEQTEYYVIGGEDSGFDWQVEGLENTLSGNGRDTVIVSWGNIAGIYSLNVIETNSFGCSGLLLTGRVIVKEAPAFSLGEDISICADTSIVLSPGSGFESYLWQNGSTENQFQVFSSGAYFVITENENNCFYTDTIIINIFPPIEIETQITNARCFGEADGSIFVNPISGSPPYSYSWNNGSTNSVINNLESGYYSITVSDKNDCKKEYSTTISQPEQIIFETVVNEAFCPETNDGSVEISGSGGISPYSYLWQNNSTSTILTNLLTGNYSFTIQDKNQCLLEASVFIPYESEICFLIPNAFSPNNDGYNDEWEILGIELYPEASIEIFNRWGQLLYSSDNGYIEKWDGKFNGKELPHDTYYYIIQLNKTEKTITGDVTIIR